MCIRDRSSITGYSKLNPSFNNFSGIILRLQKINPCANSEPISKFIAICGAGKTENFLNTFANLFENSFCVIGTGETKLTGPEMSLFSKQNL